MRKFDKFLMTVWFVFLPVLIGCFLIILAYDLFVLLDDELACFWLNIDCLLVVIYLGGWIFNIVASFIFWICEKIHFYRLNKYYQKHPEEEIKNREKLAKDFEELARIIREGEKKDE